ncbi:MAG: M20 family metallopeptidase [Bacteroidia bacterium]
MSKNLLLEVKQLAAEIFPLVRDVRRHIHQHPEISFQEIQTSDFLKTKLDEAGITDKTSWVKTGILASINGNDKGKTVTLRGDMDALPIQEESSAEYKSVHHGLMHACGHDVHSACVLGAGIILNILKDKWNGKVNLLFQPGEEQLPGGANLMLKAGIFHENNPGKMIAQHVYPALPAGSVGFRPGRYMASTDEIHIKIKGQGGHGALPHTVKDPVLAAAQVIVSLQQVVSRNAQPGLHSVLSIGKVIAQGATNVIPNEVEMQGTFRTLNEEWRAQAHELISTIIHSTCKAYGVSADVDIRKGYPVLENDVEFTHSCIEGANEFLGPDKVHELDIRMTAEDFAWFAQQYPVCFYRLGSSSPAGEFSSSVHTSTFDIDEKALETGIGLMAWLTLKELS